MDWVILIGGAAAILGVCWWWGRAGLRPLSNLIDAPVCGRCGYALDGLPPGAACPECGSTLRGGASRAGRSVPRWLWPAWGAGGVAVNAPVVALWWSEGVSFGWAEVSLLGVQPLLVLACAVLAGRRPHKGPAAAVLGVTFGVQAVIVGWIAVDWTLHPPVKGFLWQLGYILLPLEAQLWSAVAVGLVALAGACIVQARRGR